MRIERRHTIRAAELAGYGLAVMAAIFAMSFFVAAHYRGPANFLWLIGIPILAAAIDFRRAGNAQSAFAAASAGTIGGVILAVAVGAY